MKDRRHAKLQKLLADAEDRDLIGNLATDISKKATFRRMTTEFCEMAKGLAGDIAERELQRSKTPSNKHSGTKDDVLSPATH